jgi:hypothetical protein
MRKPRKFDRAVIFSRSQEQDELKRLAETSKADLLLEAQRKGVNVDALMKKQQAVIEAAIEEVELQVAAARPNPQNRTPDCETRKTETTD